MNHRNFLDELNESSYLISMTPAEDIIRIGHDAGMKKGQRILDLCCGYGEMLKLWHEAFGISGVGVDISAEFILDGRRRLQGTDVELILSDIFQWQTDEKFDYVCLSGEQFGGMRGTINLLEQFVKPNGKLIIGTRYSKVENPPKELIDFEGETLPLVELNRIFLERGYFLTAMSSDTDIEWERYIMWSARRNLAALRADPSNAEMRAWTLKWYDMYFKVRREYEGYATFVLEKL